MVEQIHSKVRTIQVAEEIAEEATITAKETMEVEWTSTDQVVVATRIATMAESVVEDTEEAT